MSRYRSTELLLRNALTLLIEELLRQFHREVTLPIKDLSVTGCFFPRILESLPPLPREHSAAIRCTKNYHPIGITVHSHCVESFEGEL